MPRDFDKCKSAGGKIVTKKLNSKQYMHVCYIDGKAHAGEVREYKTLKAKK